ncbi:MAG: ATP cone domain-containing protein, partial [Erysipelotrichaceae bacterium]
MVIIKRDGNLQEYSSEKIKNAIRKVFASEGRICPENDLQDIIFSIENSIEVKTSRNEPVTVEWIQDMVEIELMKKEYFKEVRSYIIYRDEHARTREAINNIVDMLGIKKIGPVLKKIQKDFNSEAYDMTILESKFRSLIKGDISKDYALQLLIDAAVSLICKEAPDYQFIAARILSFKIGLEVDKNMDILHLDGFYEKMVYLCSESEYDSTLLEKYDREEIEELGRYMRHSRNNLFNYSALKLLSDKYLIYTDSQGILEKPQELFMSIAMYIAMNETNRTLWAKEIYDVLSSQKLILSSVVMYMARKPKAQLASSFGDCLPDNLLGIYKSLDSFSEISKYHGGMGLYFGKIRSIGADIKDYKGGASGTVKWARLVNDTVIAVENEHLRKDACTVYLDAWHKDLPEFLQAKSKLKDIRLGVCFPDLFFEIASKNINENWYLMDPHEILQVKKYSLEDYYGNQWLDRYYECLRDDRIEKRMIPIKEMVRMLIKSLIDTGGPLIFNRDAVNMTNPNSHSGIIYCSDLNGCLAQNVSSSSLISREIIKTETGDVVAEKTSCSDMPSLIQASLNLSRINTDDNKELKHIIDIAVLSLDNMIDLNNYPVPYSAVSASKYRPIGLGALGYNHLLVKKGIDIESKEHLDFADNLFERINYFALNASA